MWCTACCSRKIIAKIYDLNEEEFTFFAWNFPCRQNKTNLKIRGRKNDSGSDLKEVKSRLKKNEKKMRKDRNRKWNLLRTTWNIIYDTKHLIHCWWSPRSDKMLRIKRSRGCNYCLLSSEAFYCEFNKSTCVLKLEKAGNFALFNA